MIRRIRPLLLLVTLAIACGPRPWWTATQPPSPHLNTTPPSRARVMYRAMGLMVDSSRLPFVASLHFLAGATPDSTLALFAMSLSTRSLDFRPEGHDFVAGYHVDLTLRSDSGVVGGAARDEVVRVRSLPETERVNESVIFQQVLAARPGVYTVSVVVRDRNSPRVYAQDTIVDTVPRFAGQGLGGPVPIYEGTGRDRVGALPLLTVNPQGRLLSGADSLRFYVEGYGLSPGTRLAARIMDADSVELWRDTLLLTSVGGLTSAQFILKPGELPLGRGEFQVEAIGVPAHARTPFLVSFSDQWAVRDFNELSGMLLYFPRQDLLAKLRAAPRPERAAAWRDFYKATDPVPLTPQNEALDEYFHRVEIANQRFEQADMPGWLGDRGEVFITLGEPDRVFETPGAVGAGLRWEYTSRRLTLYFEDQVGLGLYRLTRESRAEYGRVVAQGRRAQ
jgi:GWxTD domain-containing protein